MAKSKDLVFRVGLLVKGVDSLLEVLGGLLLTQPTKIARYLSVLSQHEVYKQHLVLAGHIDRLTDTFTTHTSLVEAGYLMLHGSAKVILILAVMRNKKWGFVGLIGVLIFFTTIEIVRAVAAKEIVTAAFALFDLLVACIIASEYKDRFLKGAQQAE